MSIYYVNNKLELKFDMILIKILKLKLQKLKLNLKRKESNVILRQSLKVMQTENKLKFWNVQMNELKIQSICLSFRVIFVASLSWKENPKK